MNRLTLWFGVGAVVAAVVVLVTFLLSRTTGRDQCFDDYWELYSVAVSVGVVGLMTVGVGVRLFYSVEGGFTPYAVPASLAVVLGGVLLCGLAVWVIAGIDCATP